MDGWKAPNRHTRLAEYLLGASWFTSITADNTGAKVSEIRYKPWGEIRYSWISGLSTTPAYKLPSYTFTGQFSDSYINLLWYGSRHYDPELGRFIQPDSIVPEPNNPQAYDRYSYVQNNPVRYTDPTGHSWEDCGNRSGYSCQIHTKHVNRAKAQWASEQQYDITAFLVEEMQAAGVEGLELTEMYDEQGGLFFVYSFMFGKYWRYGPKNIKVAIADRIDKGVILCGSEECQWVDYSTAGNILFGYAAEAAGMSEEFYSWVGGFEQMGDDAINPSESVHREWCSTSYCDDPYDLAAVQFGAQLYREYKSNITLEIFQSELTTDILDSFQPPPTTFIAPFPAHPQENQYHVGDFDYGH